MSKQKTTSTDLVPQQVEVQAKKDALRLSKLAELTIVTSAEEEAVAYQKLQEIKMAKKFIKGKFDEITKPARASLKAITSMRDQLLSPFDEANTIIRDKILVFRDAEEEKAEKERVRREKIQESHEARGHQTNDLAPVVQEVAQETVTVKRWTFKIVNIDNVPRDYFEFSSAAVRNAIRDGARSIPGLKIYQEKGIRV